MEKGSHYLYENSPFAWRIKDMVWLKVKPASPLVARRATTLLWMESSFQGSAAQHVVGSILRQNREPSSVLEVEGEQNIRKFTFYGLDTFVANVALVYN